MKQLFILVLSLFLAVSVLQAEMKSTDELIVQKLVQEVKQSKGDARRKAMNSLKIKLRSMNQETRQKVMMDLQKNFGQNSQGMQHASNRYLQKQEDRSMVHTIPGSGHMSPIITRQQSLPHIEPSTTIPSASPATQQVPLRHTPKFGQSGGHR